MINNMFHSFDPVMAVREFLAGMGLSAHTVSWVSTVILVIAVAILAWISFLLARLIIERTSSYIVRRSKSPYDDKFLETRMFRRLAMIVPGVIVYFLASWMLNENPGWLKFVHKSSALFIILFSTLTLNSFVEGWHRIYLMHPIARGRSIKPYVQLCKVFLGFAGILIMVSIVFRISLTSVFTGLGVATAVLAVVFKDMLLGLVASVQLSTNRLVALGDWITIPSRNIDGTVIDMTLYTVKVENFDKTILTVPTYALISESFQNWKGMEDSGARRIKREIRIDVRSITFITPELLDKIGRNPFTGKWLQENKAEIAAIKNGEPASLTNLGAFRAYMVEYLLHNKDIDPKMTVMIRDLPLTDSGLPMELYCFSKITSWVPFEGVMSDVMEYTISVANQFGLILFQSPAGSDLGTFRR